MGVEGTPGPSGSRALLLSFFFHGNIQNAVRGLPGSSDIFACQPLFFLELYTDPRFPVPAASASQGCESTFLPQPPFFSPSPCSLKLSEVERLKPVSTSTNPRPVFCFESLVVFVLLLWVLSKTLPLSVSCFFFFLCYQSVLLFGGEAECRGRVGSILSFCIPTVKASFRSQLSL